jgi:hypothetical protein
MIRILRLGENLAFANYLKKANQFFEKPNAEI